MLSLTMRADRDSGFGKILQDRMKNPQTEEAKKADAPLKQIDETKTKRTPSDRHEKRMAALYVEPISETAWNRPADIIAGAAHDFLVDAVNDYTGRYEQGYIAPAGLPKDIDPDLYSALEQWPARPVLPPPEYPKFPG